MDGTGIEDSPNPTAAAPLVVVTGAGGFIGGHLVRALREAGYRIRAVTRAAPCAAWRPGDAVETVSHPGVSAQADWRPALEGAHAVVHLAGLAHMALDTPRQRQELRRVNVRSTRHLAQAAARAGVSTFVFMSSIKAVADHSGDAPLTETSDPRPEDCYGLAKLAAERQLERIGRESPAMRILVLRPPLVYGAGVGANFAALARLVARGVPLPLGAICNRRSLVYVGNLTAAVVRCLQRPHVPSGIFHLSDGPPVSTPALVAAIAQAQGRPVRLLRIPAAWLARAAAATGQQARYARLTGSLEVSNRRFCEAFGWKPPFTLAQGLEATLHRAA